MKISIKRVAFVSTVLSAQFILLCLKALKIIDWGWIWVLSPLWITYIGLVSLSSIVLIAAIIHANIKRIKNGDKLSECEKPERGVQERDYKED